MAQKRHVKVLKLEILKKPACEMTWQELVRLLYAVRRRVFRLANLVLSEAYLNYHLWRTRRTEEFKTHTIGELNRQLREMLLEENVKDAEQDQICSTGALPSYVVDALKQYKIKGLTSKSKWKEVVRGTASLPTFRADMSIPVRCDKQKQHRLERSEAGDVELDLMVCTRPYPRITLKTGKLDGGPREVLERLLDNPGQAMDGYRQRCLEVKHDDRDNRWWLFVTYDFPAEQFTSLSEDKIVGADVGFACPVYVALGNGHARLGWKHFAGVAARVRTLQRQVMARRRSMLAGGRSSLSQETARSGHGRKRKLRSIEQLRGRINSAQTTLNHQLSASVVQFAKDHGAGVIQIEDLSGLKDQLTGTFLGARWRYHELQQFLEYKTKEAGIELRKVNARYTSRRCSKCGHIDVEFTRQYRDAHRKDGYVCKFHCPECDYEADPDYNAARNLATLDIDKLIEQQCQVQGLD